MVNDDKVLILHVKIYDFIEYIYHFLATYPTNEKYSLEKYIRDTLYDCLTEVIKYEKSGTISHIYNIDTNIALLKDYFKLSKDVGIKCINNNRIVIITRLLNEIGRLVGGIIISRNGKKKNTDNKSSRRIYIESEQITAPVEFYNPNEITSPVTFDSAFKFKITKE